MLISSIEFSLFAKFLISHKLLSLFLDLQPTPQASLTRSGTPCILCEIFENLISTVTRLDFDYYSYFEAENRIWKCNRGCKIFIGSIRFAKINKVFQQSIMRYIHRTRYVTRPSLPFIRVKLRLLVSATLLLFGNSSIIGLSIIKVYHFSPVPIILCSHNRSSSDKWIQPVRVQLID